MTAIRLDGLGMTYPPGVVALAGVDLAVEPGEWLVMVGPSGCGKSTLLRLVAGLEEPTQGSVELHGRPMRGVPPHQRDVALLYQKAPLLPGRAVRDNLALAWTLRQPWFRQRLSAEHDRQLREMAERLRLDDVLDRPVHQLSGGQQQRVALGRVLLRQAKICLLDEPLGHLDAPLRAELRREIQMLGQRGAMTMLYVTHDPAEALALGERVAVFDQGRLQQVGKPDELRRQPANRFVAQFCRFDRDEMNMLEGKLVTDGEALWFETALGRLPAPARLSGRLASNLNLIAGIASEDVRILASPSTGTHTMSGSGLAEAAPRLEAVFPMQVMLLESASLGCRALLHRDGTRLVSWVGSEPGLSKGQDVMVAVSLENAMWFELETGRAQFVSSC